MGPGTRSGRTPQVYLGYELVCVGSVQSLNFENKGLFKQDLKRVTGKVRRVSEAAHKRSRFAGFGRRQR